MKKKIKKHSLIWAIGFSFLLLIILSIIYTIVQYFINNTAVVNLFTYFIYCILLFISFRKLIINDIKNIKSDVNGQFKKIIIFSIILLLLEIISNYIISNSINKISVNQQETINLLKANPVIVSIYLVLFCPICEELITKIPFKLANNNRLASFIAISIYFALLHLMGTTSTLGLLYFIPYLFLSLSINYSYYKTNNMCIPIILHILNNILSIILTFTI